MGNAWTDHYQKEAQTNKMMYDMVSATYQECQAKWDALEKDKAHWTEIADLIRWARAMAKQSFDTSYGYMMNWVNYLESSSVFGSKKKVEAFVNANRNLPEWTKSAVAKWDVLTKEYGVTLTDDSNEKVEIALMADAALFDIHRYTGEKWSEAEAKSFITDICKKYEVSDGEYEAWKKVRLTS